MGSVFYCRNGLEGGFVNIIGVIFVSGVTITWAIYDAFNSEDGSIIWTLSVLFISIVAMTMAHQCPKDDE